MAFGLKRTDLQRIAESKLRDAELLLANGRVSNAYYLAGYSVEIGLKACIARTMVADTIPDKDFIQGVYVHAYQRLVGLAGLSRVLKDRQDEDAEFAANWALAAQWRPDSRYEIIDRYTAQVFLRAVAAEDTGVFKWITAHW